MNRDSIERTTASLVVLLLTTFSLGLILIVANLIFQWDIFPPGVEQLLYFLGIAILIITLSCALINIMLNISRLAFFAQHIAQHFSDKKK